MDKEARRIKRTMKAQERRRKLDKDTARPWHSRSYQREFEGFAEREITGPNGRRKIERVYVGNYYELDAAPGRRRLLKWTHVVFSVAAAVFFALSSTAEAPCNYSRLVAFFQAVEVLGLVWMLWLSLRNLFTRPRMILRTYRGTSRAILLWSRITAGAACFNGALSLLFTFLHFEESLGKGLLCVLWHVLSAAMMFLIYTIEKDQKYRVIENDTPVTDDMYVIGDTEV